MKVIFSLLLSSISIGIWFFLLYKILLAVNASELMWFLYAVYLPVVFGSSTLGILLLKERS